MSTGTSHAGASPLTHMPVPLGTKCIPCTRRGHGNAAAIEYVLVDEDKVEAQCMYCRDGDPCPVCDKISQDAADRDKRGQAVINRVPAVTASTLSSTLPDSKRVELLRNRPMNDVAVRSPKVLGPAPQRPEPAPAPIRLEDYDDGPVETTPCSRGCGNPKHRGQCRRTIENPEQVLEIGGYKFRHVPIQEVLQECRPGPKSEHDQALVQHLEHCAAAVELKAPTGLRLNTFHARVSRLLRKNSKAKFRVYRYPKSNALRIVRLDLLGK